MFWFNKKINKLRVINFVIRLHSLSLYVYSVTYEITEPTWFRNDNRSPGIKDLLTLNTPHTLPPIFLLKIRQSDLYGRCFSISCFSFWELECSVSLWGGTIQLEAIESSRLALQQRCICGALHRWKQHVYTIVSLLISLQEEMHGYLTLELGEKNKHPLIHSQWRAQIDYEPKNTTKCFLLLIQMHWN